MYLFRAPILSIQTGSHPKQWIVCLSSPMLLNIYTFYCILAGCYVFLLIGGHDLLNPQQILLPYSKAAGRIIIVLCAFPPPTYYPTAEANFSCLVAVSPYPVDTMKTQGPIPFTTFCPDHHISSPMPLSLQHNHCLVGCCVNPSSSSHLLTLNLDGLHFGAPDKK